MSKKNIHEGSTLDDFLKEEGIYEEVRIAAIKQIAVRQIEKEMKKQKINKVELSRRMNTSRIQLDRILDPKKAFNIKSMIKVADALGMKVELRLTA